MDFWSYINTTEFLLFGSFVYYIVLPVIFFLIYFFIDFAFNYTSFKCFKYEENKLVRYNSLKKELALLEKDLKNKKN